LPIRQKGEKMGTWILASRILLTGVVFLLSLACIPNHYFTLQVNQAVASSLKEDAVALPTQPGQPTSFSENTTDISNQAVNQPISEEANEDFRLESPSTWEPESETTFDIPIVMNERVEYFIVYFQTTLRDKFMNWLARSAKYIPMMKALLRENGLPEDLVYMALIESGYNPHAFSRSKACGPWQFISSTGKKYGLLVNWWIDERRDPEKSTIAAAKYLNDLYDIFECWYLAAASYNAGEGKISRGMKRYRTEDFWELTKHQYLKRETKNYVPQMIAAALVAKDPEKYGFTDIEYQEVLCYDKVAVSEVTDLGLIAKACEVSLEEIKDLNPELLRGCTPPGISDYEVRIPCGKKELFQTNFEDLKPRHRFQFKTHVVKKGDTFSSIARIYRVALEPLLQINKLKKTSRLSVGMNLLIPVPISQHVSLPTAMEKAPNGKKNKS
jgi:membrane-bound lytic murein transglycosylase D